MTLTKREKDVLRLVVEQYVVHGTPVSSGALASQVRGRGYSPATIRTELARLTEKGLLTQAHKSAGRSPTEKAFRCYLDELMQPKLRPWDRKTLESGSQEPDTARGLSRTLSGLSGQMAMVGVPSFAGSTFREIGLATCGDRQIVVYFVSPGGLTQQSLVKLDVHLESTELARIQNILNERLTHRTLSDVRALIREELDDERAQHDRLRRMAFELGLRALPVPELQLVVEGKAQLTQHPEFADGQRMHALLRAIEDKTILLGLLDKILDVRDVTVVFGSESQHSIPGVACVGGATHASAGPATAAVTIVGPTRMDYSRLVPLVRCAADLFGQRW